MTYAILAVAIVGVVIALYEQMQNAQPSGVSTVTYSANIVAIAQAIAQQEGFGPSGNLATICNNPGDLTRGDYGDTGVYRTAAGGIQIIVYASPNDGWAALYQKLFASGSAPHGAYSPLMSILSFVETYTGDHNPSDQALENYVNAICNAVGAQPTDPIGQWFV